MELLQEKVATTTAPVGVLPYDQVRERPPAKALYYLAAACAFTPLSLATLLLSLYAFVRSDSLPVLGFFLLPIGGVAAVIGLICIIVYAVQGKSSDPVRSRLVKRQSLRVGLWLIASFPIAGLYAFLGTWLMSCATVQIQNTGSKVVDRLVLSTNHGQYVFTAVQPNATVRRLTFHTDLRATGAHTQRGADLRSHVLDGGSGGFMASLLDVRVDDDAVTIEEWDD